MQQFNFLIKSRRKKRKLKRKKKQKGGWLNRYDFAYAGRDSVNQAAYHMKKIAPNLIRQSSKELDAIASHRINKLTNNTANEIKRIAPGLIRGAIEEVYKTPFRLLGNFGTNKYRQLKKKLYTTLSIRKRTQTRRNKSKK